MKSRIYIIKLLAFLLMSVFIIVTYAASFPIDKLHNKSYSFLFSGIIYSFIILSAILITGFDKLAKKDYIAAACLCLLSVPVTIPVNFYGLLSAACTFFPTWQPSHYPSPSAIK